VFEITQGFRGLSIAQANTQAFRTVLIKNRAGVFEVKETDVEIVSISPLARRLTTNASGFHRSLQEAGVSVVTRVTTLNQDIAVINQKIKNSNGALAQALSNANFPGVVPQAPATTFVGTVAPTANPTQGPTQYIKPGFIAAAVLLTVFGVACILAGVFFYYRSRTTSLEEPTKEPIVDVFLQEPISDFGARGYEPQTTTVERDTSPAKVDAIPTPTGVKPAVDNRV
jgi:hypothetical protein